MRRHSFCLLIPPARSELATTSLRGGSLFPISILDKLEVRNVSDGSSSAGNSMVSYIW